MTLSKFLLLLLIDSTLIMVVIAIYALAKFYYKTITGGNVLDSIMSFVGIVLLVIVAAILFAMSIELLRLDTVDLTEYEVVTEKLEANPFDEETLKEAIDYNLKVERAKQYDFYNLENEYEDYLNEPEIDIAAYQSEYIEEKFGFDTIIKN